jgi:hypothetical protein
MSNDNVDYQNFVEGLPPEIQSLGMARDSTSPDAFWKRVLDNNTYAGQSIRVPTENASDEERSQFHEKLRNKVPDLMITPSLDDQDSVTAMMQTLGMPSEANAYENIEGENIAFSDGQQESIKQLALKAGLTRAQYKALAQSIGEDSFNMQGKQQAALEASENTLKAEWGLAAEAKYKQAVEFAKNGGAPESLVQKLEGRTADASTVMWLSGLANQVSEAPNATSQANGTPQTLTPYEASEQIREILSNKEHGYHNGDPRARSKMHELMRAANPEDYA